MDDALRARVAKHIPEEVIVDTDTEYVSVERPVDTVTDFEFPSDLDDKLVYLLDDGLVHIAETRVEVPIGPDSAEVEMIERVLEYEEQSEWSQVSPGNFEVHQNESAGIIRTTGDIQDSLIFSCVDPTGIRDLDDCVEIHFGYWMENIILRLTDRMLGNYMRNNWFECIECGENTMSAVGKHNTMNIFCFNCSSLFKLRTSIDSVPHFDEDELLDPYDLDREIHKQIEHTEYNKVHLEDEWQSIDPETIAYDDSSKLEVFKSNGGNKFVFSSDDIVQKVICEGDSIATTEPSGIEKPCINCQKNSGTIEPCFIVLDRRQKLWGMPTNCCEECFEEMNAFYREFIEKTGCEAELVVAEI